MWIERRPRLTYELEFPAPRSRVKCLPSIKKLALPVLCCNALHAPERRGVRYPASCKLTLWFSLQAPHQLADAYRESFFKAPCGGLQALPLRTGHLVDWGLTRRPRTRLWICFSNYCSPRFSNCNSPFTAPPQLATLTRGCSRIQRWTLGEFSFMEVRLRVFSRARGEQKTHAGRRPDLAVAWKKLRPWSPRSIALILLCLLLCPMCVDHHTSNTLMLTNAHPTRVYCWPTRIQHACMLTNAHPTRVHVDQRASSTLYVDQPAPARVYVHQRASNMRVLLTSAHPTRVHVDQRAFNTRACWPTRIQHAYMLTNAHGVRLSNQPDRTLLVPQYRCRMICYEWPVFPLVLRLDSPDRPYCVVQLVGNTSAKLSSCWSPGTRCCQGAVGLGLLIFHPRWFRLLGIRPDGRVTLQTVHWWNNVSPKCSSWREGLDRGA